MKIRWLLFSALLAVAAAADPTADARRLADSRTAFADVDVLSILNRLGLDRQQALELLPICRRLRTELDELDRDLAAAEQARARELQIIHQGLIEGKTVGPQGVQILAALNDAQGDHDARRQDAMVKAYGDALEVLTEQQAAMLSDPEAAPAETEQEALLNAIREQRMYFVRRQAVAVTLRDLARRARQTPNRQQFLAQAPGEVSARIVAITGLPPESDVAQQLGRYLLNQLGAIYQMSPVEFEYGGRLLVDQMAEATMYVVAAMQPGAGQASVRVPSALFQEALAYPRIVSLLQHLARERTDGAQNEPATDED